MAALTAGSASRTTSRRSPRPAMRVRMSTSVSWQKSGGRVSRARAARSALTWRVHSATAWGGGSGVESGLVAGQACVAVGDGGLGIWRWQGRDGSDAFVGGVHLADGLPEPVRREDRGQPPVDGGQQVGFAEVDVGRVADVAGQGVFAGVAAPVVGSLVAVLALHPAAAVAAVQPPAQDVGADDSLVGFAGAAAGAPGAGHDGLGGLEVFVRDQRLVGDGVGPDPAAGRVPPQPGFISGGDVVDVEEDLVLALLVPDLPAGVAGIGQDGADGGFGPCPARKYD